MRNKKLGYKFAIDTNLYLAPKGAILKKRGTWMPHPNEYCGYENYYVGEPAKFHPYALYRHCMEATHIKYLVKYKIKELLVRSDLMNFSELMYIMSMSIDDMPLIINNLDGLGKLSEYCKLLYKDRLANICQME